MKLFWKLKFLLTLASIEPMPASRLGIIGLAWGGARRSNFPKFIEDLLAIGVEGSHILFWTSGLLASFHILMRFSLPIESQRSDLYWLESEVSETSNSNCSGSETPKKISILRYGLISFQNFFFSAGNITLIIYARWLGSRISMRRWTNWATLMLSLIPSNKLACPSWRSRVMTWSHSSSGENVFFSVLISLRICRILVYVLAFLLIFSEIDVHWPALVSKYLRISIWLSTWTLTRRLSIWWSVSMVNTCFRSLSFNVFVLNRFMKLV